jgi:hypothetical protein
MKPLAHDGRCTILRFPSPPRFGLVREVATIEKITRRVIQYGFFGQPREVTLSLPRVKFLEQETRP